MKQISIKLKKKWLVSMDTTMTTIQTPAEKMKNTLTTKISDFIE